VFGSPSKADAGPPIGINGARTVVQAPALPCAAIGGISIDNVCRVAETGAAMSAVISGLLCAAPDAAARAFLERWERAPR